MRSRSAAEFTPGEWATYKKEHPKVDPHHHDVVPAQKRGPKPESVKERSRTQAGKEEALKDRMRADETNPLRPDVARFLDDESFQNESLAPIWEVLNKPPKSLIKALVGKSVPDALVDIVTRTLTEGPLGDEKDFIRNFATLLAIELTRRDADPDRHEGTPSLSKSLPEAARALEDEECLSRILQHIREMGSAEEGSSDPPDSNKDDGFDEELSDVEEARTDESIVKEAVTKKLLRRLSASSHEAHQMALTRAVGEFFTRHFEKNLERDLQRIRNGVLPKPTQFQPKPKSRKSPVEQAVLWRIGRAMRSLSEVEPSIEAYLTGIQLDPYRFDPHAIKLAITDVSHEILDRYSPG